MKISVIMPIYNAEKYLEKSVRSVMDQTYKDIEIILVNDGSSDASVTICEKLESLDNRIRLYTKTNEGAGEARNFGIEKSTGDYIVFLDSDDYIEANTIEEMLLANDDNYDLVVCGFDRIDIDTGRIFSNEMNKNKKINININEETIMDTVFIPPACWGKMFKREIIVNHKFSRNTIEDIIYFLKIIPEIKKIKYVNRILWHYMVHKNSIIANIKIDSAINFQNDLLEIKQMYQNNNYRNYYFEYLTLQVFIHNCISIPSRLYTNKEVNIKEYICSVKDYMNSYFPDWKRMKIKTKGHKIKKIAIYTVKNMYRSNTFILFLYFYNFMINKLKIDVKW